MINSIYVAPQTVLQNGEVLFDTNRIKTNSCVEHKQGTSSFIFSKKGIYRIIITGTSKLLADCKTGMGTVTLFQDDKLIEGTVIGIGKNMGTLESFTVATFVKVMEDNSSSFVTLKNTSMVSIEVIDANILIERIA